MTHERAAARGDYETAYELALAEIERLEQLCGINKGLPRIAGLTPQMALLLWTLALPRGESAVVSTEAIWAALWGDRADPPMGDPTIKVRIYQLRRWLRQHVPSARITCFWGVGYQLSDKAAVRAVFEQARLDLTPLGATSPASRHLVSSASSTVAP